MEAEADEVRSAVGRCAHQNAAVGQKVVNLVVQVPNTRTRGHGVRLNPTVGVYFFKPNPVQRLSEAVPVVLFL